jgi:hypothetical protein
MQTQEDFNAQGVSGEETFGVAGLVHWERLFSIEQFRDLPKISGAGRVCTGSGPAPDAGGEGGKALQEIAITLCFFAA